MIISVFDPGLESATGHHMALLEYFLDHAITGTEICYYCAKEFDISATSLLLSTGSVSVNPVFSGGFYDRYNEDLCYSGANNYVLSLSSEYFQLLHEVTEKNTTPDSKVCILLPTLLWEHALAFEQALQRFKQCSELNCLHVVSLLMFNPVCFETIGSGRLTLNFVMAFRALSKHSEVEFFAGDQETMNAYESIIGTSARVSSVRNQSARSQVGLHPCYLIKQQQSYRKADQTYKIGYLGDAKREKGFLLLPEMIDKFANSDNSEKLLVQYTLESSCHELRAVDQQLIQMAEKLTNVELVRGYISSEILGNYLSNSVEIVLNYDEDIYLNKTSGLVWLAAYHSVELRCSRISWIWREYQRLSRDEGGVVVKNLDCAAQDFESRPDYYQEIFAPFVPWLISKYSSGSKLEGNPMTISV